MPIESPVSDNDRLIAVLQTCFSELIKKQEDQGDRLHRAMEALKTQVPATDKKTSFWNSYMKLADEHDKEFQQKYSTDLDTALIFAGLFSAVSSAFIIQIQPQLMVSNPSTIILVAQCMLYISLLTTLLAALLAVLGKQWIMYYQAAGSRGTIEERGLERQRKLDGVVKWKFDALLQMFPLLLQLALLLFSTSLAIYLWTVHHSIAILVMVLTSFGFAAYFFLLLSAIIFPDCPFQTPLAPFLVHIISPCLCPLQPILRKLQRAIWDVQSSFTRFSDTENHLLPRFVSNILPSKPIQSESTDIYPPTYFSPASPEVPAILWVLGTSTDPKMISTAAEMAGDLQWSLDLDPKSLETAMTRLAETLHSCFNIRFRGPFSVGRVRDGMHDIAVACGRLYCSLRLISRVTKIQPEFILGQAAHLSQLYQPYSQGEFADGSAELENVLQILNEGPDLMKDWQTSSASIKWALHVIPSLEHRFISLQAVMQYFLDHFPENVPSLDLPSFTNYLCCVNSLLSPVEPRLMVQTNKSSFRDLLMTQLFERLLDSTLDPLVIARIIKLTAKLAPKLTEERSGFLDLVKLIKQTSRFCNTFPRMEGWLDVAVSAIRLTRVDDVTEFRDIHGLASYTPSLHSQVPEPEAQDVQWIYVALQHVQQLWTEIAGSADSNNWDDSIRLIIDGLLQVLACSGTLSENPPVESLDIILRALSAPTSVAFTAFLVLKQGKTWFLDPHLQPIMHNSSVWCHLSRVAVTYKSSAPFEGSLIMIPYIDMIQTIATKPEWRSAAYPELPSWITVLSEGEWDYPGATLTSVFRDIWVPEFDEQHQFTDDSEHLVALALTALSNVWEVHDFRTSPVVERFLQLTRCTVSTSLWSSYHHNRTTDSWSARQGLPPNLMLLFSAPLFKSMKKAAANARNTIPSEEMSPDNKHYLEGMAELLDMLAESLAKECESSRMKVEVEGPRQDRNVWEDLKKNLLGKIDAFEESLSAEHGD